MPRAWVAGPAHTGAAPWPAGWRLTGSFCLNNPSHCMGELRDGCWLLLKFNSLPCIICQPYPHSSFLVSATREEAGRADCPWRWQLMGSCSLPAHTAMPSLHWGHGSPKHTPLGLHTTWGTMLISILCRLNTVLVSLSRWECLTLAINRHTTEVTKGVITPEQKYPTRWLVFLSPTGRLWGIFPGSPGHGRRLPVVTSQGTCGPALWAFAAAKHPNVRLFILTAPNPNF